jgi:hypothetical protein
MLVFGISVSMFLARHNMSYPHLSSSFTVGNNLYFLNGKIPYFLYLPRKRLNGKSIVFSLLLFHLLLQRQILPHRENNI